MTRTGLSWLKQHQQNHKGSYGPCSNYKEPDHAARQQEQLQRTANDANTKDQTHKQPTAEAAATSKEANQ